MDPAFAQTEGCNKDTFEDVLSVMARNGALDKRVFTICLSRDFKHGSFAVGLNETSIPEGAVKVPLQPMDGVQSHYMPAISSAGVDFHISLGDSTESVHLSKEQYSEKVSMPGLLDTGTPGCSFPKVVGDAVAEVVGKNWFESSSCRAFLADLMNMEVTSITAEILTKQVLKGVAFAYAAVAQDHPHYSKEEFLRGVEALIEHIPDVSVDFGTGPVTCANAIDTRHGYSDAAHPNQHFAECTGCAMCAQDLSYIRIGSDDGL